MFWKDRDNVVFVKCSLPEASSAFSASQFARNLKFLLNKNRNVM